MKALSILIMLFLCAIHGNAQISPFLKVGVGYPSLVYEDESVSPDYHTLKTYPSISVEKPIPIEIRLKPRLSINPGLDYYFFKEHKYDVFDDASGLKDFKFNRHTLNGYIKALFQFKPIYNREGFFYFGGAGGVRIFTYVNGTKYIKGLNEEIPELEVNENINSKDFFSMFYYGGIAGWQPHFKKYKMVKFSVEFGYYPDFISMYEETSPDMVSKDAVYKKVDLWQLSLYLGFRRR